MGDNVHYLPIALGTEHLVRPLIRSEIDVDRVKLLIPVTAGDPLDMISATKSELEDTLGLPVSVDEVDTSEFAGIVAKGYDDILQELSFDNKIYINVASPYWSLGAGYATAAELILEELTHQPDNETVPDVSTPRDTISLYYTEPKEYRIAELVEVGHRVQEFRSDFQDVWQAAQELKDEVESDRQTIEGIEKVFEQIDNDIENLTALFERLEAVGIEPTDEEGIGRGIKEIITGIDAVITGMDILASEDNRAIFEDTILLGPMPKIIEGVEDVSARAENSDDRVTTTALLDYFTDRLENVYNVLHRIEILQEDFETKFDESPEEFANVLDAVESHGIAQGVHTYEKASTELASQVESDREVHYAELPRPLQFGLKPIQRAILYTLATTGSADSIRQFTNRLVQQALITAEETGLESPEGAEIVAIRDGEFVEAANLLNETVLPTIQSRVQYHLDKLETDGFINKRSLGQSTSVELTRAGTVYLTTQTFDNKWLSFAFKGLCEKIDNICE